MSHLLATQHYTTRFSRSPAEIWLKNDVSSAHKTSLSLVQQSCHKNGKSLVNTRLFMAPPAGLEPATSWLTVMRSTDWAKEEYKAERDEHVIPPPCLPVEGVSIDLSYRAVASRVLSAQVSLTTVFGMGTGGPSPLMTLTSWMLLTFIFCFFSFVPHMGWCTFRDSNPGPTD